MSRISDKKIRKLREKIVLKQRVIKTYDSKIEKSKKLIKELKRKIREEKDSIRIYEKQIGITTRTIEMNIIFACCYDGIYYPEPIPLTLTDVQDEGFKIKSLTVWKDIFLNQTEIVDYITELCNSKCQRAVEPNATLCEDGFEIEILDFYEE